MAIKSRNCRIEVYTLWNNDEYMGSRYKIIGHLFTLVGDHTYERPTGARRAARVLAFNLGLHVAQESEHEWGNPDFII